MYDEDDLAPISALQHMLFCERRAALIHLEGLWDENVFTAKGEVEHQRAHEAGNEARGDVLVVRGLRLRSLHLGLSGQADVVEYHRRAHGETNAGVHLENREGSWWPVPVEYKSGHKRSEEGYEIQLCAQALCLEEMLNIAVERGALYYAASQRRLEVLFTGDLRERTSAAALRLHGLLATGMTPPPSPSSRCRSCSLYGQCLPSTAHRRSVLRYIADATQTIEGQGL